jgi:pimeloyl-ACP methyl ester carboxylesterase
VSEASEATVVAEFRWIEAGEDLPVLCLHGLFGSSDHWETLQALNTDYRAKRAGDVGMAAPRLTAVAPGSFHRWLVAPDKLGDQHKIPRASNERDAIEAVLAAASAEAIAR